MTARPDIFRLIVVSFQFFFFFLTKEATINRCKICNAKEYNTVAHVRSMQLF